MAFKKMEQGRWEKWADKETPVDSMVTGRVAELTESKYGPMCIVENMEGRYLMSGKSFYSTVLEHQEEGEPLVWKIKLGDILRVTFKGLTPTDKGNPMKNYIIEVDE